MSINISGKRRKGLSLLASGLCLVATSAAVAAPPATVPGTYGSLTIGDLPGTIDRIGTLANKINPGLSGESIRSLLGMQLGDAGLASIPAGSGMIAVMTTKGQPFFLLETAEGKAKTLSESISQRGPKVVVVNDKLLAIAMNDEGLAEAKGEMGTAAAASLAKSDDKFLFFTVDADQVIKDKSNDIKGAMKQAATKAGENSSASAAADVLPVLGNMIVAIGQRSDVATIKVDISAEGIQFEKTLYPVGGVTLAKPEGPTGEELSKMIPGNDTALGKYDSYIDTQSSIKVIGDIMTESTEGTAVSAGDKESLKSLFNTAGEAFGDGLAGWMSIDKNGSNATYVITVLNQEKAVSYVEDAINQINSGSLGNLYKSMGMETSGSLTKNAGTVEGQPFHTFSISMKSEKGSQMPSMGMLQEVKDAKFTFLNDKMILTLGNASLDKAVAAVKSGSAADANKLKSRSDLPAGGAFYADYDAGSLGEVLMRDNAQIGKAVESIKGTPILEALYIDEESVKFNMLIPGDLITKTVSTFQGMAMQAQQEAMDDSSDDDSKSTTPSNE